MPAKQPSRRPKAPMKKLVGVIVPDGTTKQLAKLKKIFKAKAISTLGVGPSAVISRQSLAKRRKRGR